MPRRQVQGVEPAQLATGITDYYLNRYPDEQKRAGWTSVVRAAWRAIEWPMEDARESECLK